MQAINEIERSEFTDPIILKTQETAPTEAPSNVQVQSGDEGELVVTWQVNTQNHSSLRIHLSHVFVNNVT